MIFINAKCTDNYKRYNGNGFANVVISNDSKTDNIEFSENGATVKGVLLPNETLELLNANISDFFIRAALPGTKPAYRIWFYDKVNQKQQSDNENTSVYVPRNLSRFI